MTQARLIKVTHWMDQNSSGKDLLVIKNRSGEHTVQVSGITPPSYNFFPLNTAGRCDQLIGPKKLATYTYIYEYYAYLLLLDSTTVCY